MNELQGRALGLPRDTGLILVSSISRVQPTRLDVLKGSLPNGSGPFVYPYKAKTFARSHDPRRRVNDGIHIRAQTPKNFVPPEIASEDFNHRFEDVF